MGRFNVAIFLAIILFVGVVFGQEKEDAKAEAKARFLDGLSLAKQENFDGAIVAFEKSLELYPTKNALFNLGQAYKKSTQYAAATDAFSRLLTTYADELTQEMKKSTQTHLDELGALVSTLRLDISPLGAIVTINGKEVSLEEDSFITVDPGDVELSVSLDGYDSETRRLTMSAGETLEESIELTPIQEVQTPVPESTPLKPVAIETATKVEKTSKDDVEPKSNMLKPLFLAGVVSTVATGITTAVFLGLAQANANDFDSYNKKIKSGKIDPDDTDALSEQDDASEKAARFSYLGLGFGIATGVFAAATAAVFVINRKKQKTSEHARFMVAPGVFGVTY